MITDLFTEVQGAAEMLKERRDDITDFSVYANRSGMPDILTSNFIEVRDLDFVLYLIQINIRVIFLLFDEFC